MIRDQELAGLAMTLGRDAKIRITVSGDGSYCTPDGSHINIARMPSTPIGRLLMTGLVFHEVGHKNYTQGGRPDGLLGDMMNVIEDTALMMCTGRIELDLIKLDDLMHERHGDYEDSELSMSDIISQEYGTVANAFVNVLIQYEKSNEEENAPCTHRK
jgi:hypothetical protein